jgi:hypothetical protein
MRERDKIMNRIHLLKAQIPLAKYTEVKKNYDNLKIKVKEKKDFVTATKNAIAPIQDRVK